jgi:hypothetical protein
MMDNCRIITIFATIINLKRMKPMNRYQGLLATIICAFLCVTANSQDQRFTNPPKEAHPYVWWHWINGNTSKDGIRKDLEWMNRIGIAGFHQFDAGGSMMQGLPPVVPQTPYLSDAWKENFAYAIHLADSLGMEVGIASAPGWSSTGGPWVVPADAMKKLTWRTLEVKGNGKSQTLTLPEPYKTIGRFQNVSAGIYAPVFEKMPQWYQDIAVVAVRVPEAEKSMQELGATITSSGGDFTVEQLTNGDINDGPELALNKEGTHAWIQYNFPQAVTIRSFTLVGGQEQGQFDPDRTYDNTLLCSQDGNTWTEVIRVPSSNLTQITVDIPETTAKHFRLKVINPQPDYSLIYYGAQVVIPTGTPIHEWKLNTVYKVNHAEEKAGFASPGDLLQLPTPTTEAPVQETIDLTDKVKDGVLTWKAPAGKWRIYRFGASLTGKQNHPAPPEATGLEVDKLDADAWNRYFHTYLDMYKDAANGLLGARGIQYLMIDSYEAQHMTWTPKMEQAFKMARGYDLRLWLPALTGEIIGSSKATEDFLFDWRETIGELFAANYDRVNDILHEYGMKGRYTESHENARTFVGDGMDPKRSATVPMAAIWTVDAAESVAYQADIRESASTAHIYGQNIVAGESFTTNGMLGGAYTWYPGNLKEVADVALMSGLNRFFIHESAHQPSDDFRPGLGLLIFGQWFSRHETWAEYAKYWLDYLARSSYYLQAGRNVADVLWFYGEDTNIASAYGKALPDVPDTYNYDFCSPHALLNCISAKDYKVIALGEHAQNMSIEVLRKLHQLVSEGVFLIGKEPVSMAGRCDNAKEFEQLKADIWHTNRSNVWTGSVADGLKHSGVAPDFQSSVPGIRFVHRVDGNRNIYWVRNFSGKEVDTDIVLRDAKGTLTVMNPVNGKPVYGVLHNGKLHLGADDALFIVADPAAAPIAEPAPLKPAGEVAFNGPWTVSFEGQDAPKGIRTWQTLSSLTESDEPDVKYFSGTATYQNTFTLPKKDLPAGLSIDLGAVGQMADIFINGEHVDFLWKAPYKVNFEGKLKPGKNTIEVKVVNTWVNRIIGDGQPDVEGHSFTPVAFYGVKSLTQNMGTLTPSGLIGPVRLEMLHKE